MVALAAGRAVSCELIELVHLLSRRTRLHSSRIVTMRARTHAALAVAVVPLSAIGRAKASAEAANPEPAGEAGSPRRSASTPSTAFGDSRGGTAARGALFLPAAIAHHSLDCGAGARRPRRLAVARLQRACSGPR